MKIKLCLFLFSLMLLLLSAGIVSAATPNFTISSTAGNGVFTIYGTNMDGVAGMDVTIKYDLSTLSRPRVAFGSLVSGSMLSTYNTNVSGEPNTIKLATGSINPYKGSGVIATISFDRISGSPGIITSMEAQLSSNNNLIQPHITINNPSASQQQVAEKEKITEDKAPDNQSPENPSPNDTTDNTTDNTTTTNQGGWIGSVTMTSPDPPAAEQKTPSGQAESTGTINGEQQVSEPVTSYAEPQQQADSTQEEKKEARKEQFVSHLSMIERFRQYEGERTPAKLLALLKETGKGYSQDPPVLLSDGKATVKVSISLPPDTTTAPNVAISREGQMVSFRRGDEGTWIVELRPKKDVGQVTLTYFINDQVTEIPLTVAPKLESFRGKPFAKLTEEEFAQFIAGRTAAKEIQPHDLNKDQVLNHIDDFIFSANYLVQVPPVKTDKAPPVAKPAPEPPASKPQEKAKPAAAGSGKP